MHPPSGECLWHNTSILALGSQSRPTQDASARGVATALRVQSRKVVFPATARRRAQVCSSLSARIRFCVRSGCPSWVPSDASDSSESRGRFTLTRADQPRLARGRICNPEVTLDGGAQARAVYHSRDVLHRWSSADFLPAALRLQRRCSGPRYSLRS